MRTRPLEILLFAALAGIASVALADVVYLDHGARLEGRIVERSEDSVRIDIGAGTMTLPMSKVDRIEEGRSSLDEFDERVSKLSDDDRDGWLELARWASGAGLGTQSLQAYERVLKLDPGHPEANRAVGRVQIDGRWMTQDDAYRARGYVNFEGQWMTPAEQDSILRSREADRAAEAQARSAEAAAREAEARAEEAQAESWRSHSSGQLHWGTWGPGPRRWPKNPLDRQGMFDSGRTQGQP